jgi:hypothetical protein
MNPVRLLQARGNQDLTMGHMLDFQQLLYIENFSGV